MEGALIIHNISDHKGISLELGLFLRKAFTFNFQVNNHSLHTG